MSATDKKVEDAFLNVPIKKVYRAFIIVLFIIIIYYCLKELNEYLMWRAYGSGDRFQFEIHPGNSFVVSYLKMLVLPFSFVLLLFKKRLGWYLCTIGAVVVIFNQYYEYYGYRNSMVLHLFDQLLGKNHYVEYLIFPTLWLLVIFLLSLKPFRSMLGINLTNHLLSIGVGILVLLNPWFNQIAAVIERWI